MSIKRWFDRSARQPEHEELSIDDLIVLERYGEAEARLKAKLKSDPRAVHTHLKLAEVYVGTKDYDKAVEEYVYAAEEYAQDGFYEKGQALLIRASKLRPLDDSLRRKAAAFEQAKRLERSRALAVEGLVASLPDGTRSATAALAVGRLWHNLAPSPLVTRLSGEQIRRAFAAMELSEFATGHVLATRGSTVAELFLLARGVVEAVAAKPGASDSVLRTFGAGDLFGEGALLEHRPWPATYRVAEAASCLVLRRPGLEQALLGNPDPRGFLDALRAQGHDREVESLVRRLTEPGA